MEIKKKKAIFHNNFPRGPKRILTISDGLTQTCAAETKSKSSKEIFLKPKSRHRWR